MRSKRAGEAIHAWEMRAWWTVSHIKVEMTYVK